MIIGYIRVSTENQDITNQRRIILEYANDNNLHDITFEEIKISSRKSRKERKITKLLTILSEGDVIIITELSRLGRSVSEVTTIVQDIIEKNIRLICIKERIDTNNKQDINTKVIITMFSLLSELERDLISLRTKEALKTRKDQGIKLGRPKGTIRKCKLEKHKKQIQEYLDIGISKLAISKLLKVSYPTLFKYIKDNNMKGKVIKKV
jgi:DNA invertase Pin-like site-specific DNA recombinase